MEERSRLQEDLLSDVAIEIYKRSVFRYLIEQPVLKFDHMILRPCDNCQSLLFLLLLMCRRLVFCDVLSHNVRSGINRSRGSILNYFSCFLCLVSKG